MAKSDHGLPARSGATKQQISREHMRIREAYAYGVIDFAEFERRYKTLKKAGKLWRKA